MSRLVEVLNKEEPGDSHPRHKNYNEKIEDENLKAAREKTKDS